MDLVIDIQCSHIFPSFAERRRVADLAYRWVRDPKRGEEGCACYVCRTRHRRGRVHYAYLYKHMVHLLGVNGRLLRPGGLALVVTGNAEEPPRVDRFSCLWS